MLVTGCFCLQSAAAAENAITTADRSVVRVIVKSGGKYVTGTGFVVSADGIVVTNNHVVDNGDEVWVWVKQPDGEPLDLPATIKWVSVDYDLALLKVPGLNRPQLTISSQLPLGDKLLIKALAPSALASTVGKLLEKFLIALALFGLFKA